jgi:vitamin B12 transporter
MCRNREIERPEMSFFPVILAAAAAAQPAVPSSDTILVSARIPLSADRFGGSVTVLSREELERLQSPLLFDVLRLQPGVTFSANGGPGGFTAVRLRGAEGEQTTLVIDGVKVADTASPGGGADFANLSTAQIGRVEILRGPQSLAWGSQAIGGVIAIETRSAGAEPAADARIEGGSRDSFLARGDVSGRIGPVALSAGGNWQRTDGISAAAESRGNTERDGYESWGGAARADIELGAGFVADLRGRFQQSEVGIDGFAPPTFAFGDTDDRQRTRELSGVAGLGYKGERVSARIGWQASDIDRRTFAPGQADSFASEGRLERLDLRADWKAAGWLTFAGGLEREISRIRTEDAFTPDPFTARATLEGGWLQALLAPADGIDLQAGIRHDDHSRFGGATTLAASGSWVVADPLRLRASWGEGFKAPTLFQLFSDFGNETLQPERATGWDVGADLSLPLGLTVSGSWFQRVTRDQIDFASCFGSSSPICVNRPFGVYDNIARTKARGLELAVGMKPMDGLVVQANYTNVDARNQSEGSPNAGNVLARRPRHSMALVGDYQAPAGWAFGATLGHVSGSFDNASNSRPIEGYVTADLRASVPLGKRIELYGRVTNLFDATYETVSFYGQPGRQAFVGLRARL